MKSLGDLLKTCGKGAGAVLAFLGGNEILKDTFSGVLKDTLSMSREDELICESILCSIAKPESLKVLLTDVRAEIEQGYREFVIRRHGDEREFYEARNTKELKDGALMTIGQSPKDPKTGKYTEGEQVAYKLFEGVRDDNTQDDDAKRELIKRNMLTIGTNRRELSKTKLLSNAIGDSARRINNVVKKDFPNITDGAGEIALDTAVFLQDRRNKRKEKFQSVKDLAWLGESGYNIFTPVKKIWLLLVN